ncbi:hypothetical protein ABZX30_10610 [Streptomyces sp. NPDC004542]|uniref:hypothetical protein n=1 Tax=Streptomyces sp. NPDC004542 TaxID=3154281 RepID=UPI0033AC3D31
MTALTPARALVLLWSGITCLVVVAGGVLGALLGGWTASVVAGLSSGVVCTGGSVLVRRRVMAGFAVAEQEAMARGYAEGLSHGLLVVVAQYEAAVFPMSVGGVTAKERLARRSAAYRLAAEAALSTPVRVAAAAALAALDEGDPRRSREAIGRLLSAVHPGTGDSAG